MSYFVSAIIILIAFLSVIALFDEVREAIKARRRKANKSESEELVARAAGMNGQLYKMSTDAFQQLVIHVYEGIGYRVKALTVGKDCALILEQNGVYALMIYKNHQWPMSCEILEICYHHKTKMMLDAMLFLSIGGFNESACKWSKGQSDVKLINEDGFVDLCKEMAKPLSRS
jgi:hypothetical protein